MRFKITLQSPNRQQIPINYQYPISAWLYHTLAKASPEFSDWLHNHGYVFSGNRRYKLFTFSRLEIPGVRMLKETEQLEVPAGDFSLTVSFCMEEAAAHFLTGLFQYQEMELGDRYNKARFRVQNLERMPDPIFGEQARFTSLSPVCLSRMREYQGRLHPEYLVPGTPGYDQLFFENLVRRYETARASSPASLLKPLGITAADCRLALHGEPRSRLVKIKAHTPQETKVRGYEIGYTIDAPAKLIAFGYEAGFGEKGSMGFGCAEVAMPAR